MALKTYLGEFCAHKDEKTQSQELVRRLHLCPPVCGSASHMQIPRTPLSLSQGLSGRYGLSGARFRLLLLCWIPSKTQQYRSQYLFRKIVSVHIYFDLGVEVSARSSVSSERPLCSSSRWIVVDVDKSRTRWPSTTMLSFTRIVPKL